MNKTNRNGTDERPSFDFLHTLKGIIVSYFASVVLLLLLSVAAVYACFDATALGIGVNAVTAVSLVLCGLISAKGLRRAGLLNGAFSGLMYTIILYIAGSAVNMSCEFTFSTLTVFVMGLICGAFGGVIGINFNKNHR